MHAPCMYFIHLPFLKFTQTHTLGCSFSWTAKGSRTKKKNMMMLGNSLGAVAELRVSFMV